MEGTSLEPGDAFRFRFALPADEPWSFQPRVPCCWVSREVAGPTGGALFAQDCPAIQVISSGAGGEFELLLVNRGPSAVSGPILDVYRVVTRRCTHDLTAAQVVNVTETIPGAGGRHVHELNVAAGVPQTVTTTHDLVTGTDLVQDLALPLPGSARVLELQLLAAQAVRLRLVVQDEGCEGTTQVRLNQPDGAVLFSARLTDCATTQDILTSADGLYRLTVSIPSDARPEFVKVEVMRGSAANESD